MVSVTITTFGCALVGLGQVGAVWQERRGRSEATAAYRHHYN